MIQKLQYSLILLLLTLGFNGLAQERGMNLYGRTLELNLLDSSESKVGQIPLRIFKNDSLFLETESTKAGKYNCFLPFGHKYQVHYGKAPYVAKVIVFDLTKVGGKTERKGYSLDLDMAIFQSEDPMLKLLHQEPVAKAEYTKRPDLIIFDQVYSQQHGDEARRVIQSLRKNMK